MQHPDNRVGGLGGLAGRSLTMKIRLPECVTVASCTVQAAYLHSLPPLRSPLPLLIPPLAAVSAEKTCGCHIAKSPCGCDKIKESSGSWPGGIMMRNLVARDTENVYGRISLSGTSKLQLKGPA
jgi:hypothetical protein